MTAWSRIVVGVDGSDCSVRALSWAADEARAHGAELTVVTAYPTPSSVSDMALGIPTIDQTDWKGEAETALQGTLEDTLGKDPGVTVQTQAVEGSPTKALIKLSRKADLLVVGTRGHGGFKGMLLGSVSQHLTAHSHCAVTVVR